jgi:hypothetical protein
MAGSVVAQRGDLVAGGSLSTTPVVAFRVEGLHIRVQTSYDHKERCKAVDGAKWNPATRTWDYPADHYTANALRTAFKGVGRAVADEGFRELLSWAAIDPHVTPAKTMNLPFDPSIDPRYVDPATLPDIPISKTQAWGHQKRGFWFVIQMLGGLPE